MHRESGYLALCYHYIRPPKERDPFPNLLGNRENVFERHIRMVKENYEVVAPQDVWAVSYQQRRFDAGRYGVLFSFDDGLSDHYVAAQMLANHSIKAFFFIPTCALKDGEPANPTIVHYCLARYRIGGFLKAYRNALEAYKLSVDQFNIPFVRGEHDAWETISKIKATFRYELKFDEARNVLLHVFEHLLLKDLPDALELMHLTHDQIQDMVDMGHSIGVHSHSHLSVAASHLDATTFNKEMVEPKYYFQDIFQVPIQAMSYPFGGRKDCLAPYELQDRTEEYQLAYTVENIVNTQYTSPLELGRYMPMSTDDDVKLHRILERIISKNGDIQ